MSEEEQPQPEPQPTGFDYVGMAKAWVQNFEKVVRQRIYDRTRLRHLFHDKLVWFGIESNITSNLDQTIEQEFKEQWPGQVGFTCDMSRAVVFPDQSAVFILIPWLAKSKIAGAPDKTGRATFIIAKFEEEKVLCLHGHISQNPVKRITR